MRTKVPSPRQTEILRALEGDGGELPDYFGERTTGPMLRHRWVERLQHSDASRPSSFILRITTRGRWALRTLERRAELEHFAAGDPLTDAMLKAVAGHSHERGTL